MLNLTQIYTPNQFRPRIINLKRRCLCVPSQGQRRTPKLTKEPATPLANIAYKVYPSQEVSTVRASILLLAMLFCASAFAQPFPERNVTVQLKNVDGNPAANAAVKATYDGGKEIVYIDAVTDGEGRVTFINLPTSPVILWGKDVPAMEIGGMTDKVLPLSGKDNGQISFEFRIPLNGITHGEAFDFIAGKPTTNNKVSRHFINPKDDFLTKKMDVWAGRPISFCYVVRSDDKFFVAAVQGMYCPYRRTNDK